MNKNIRAPFSNNMYAYQYKKYFFRFRKFIIQCQVVVALLGARNKDKKGF